MYRRGRDKQHMLKEAMIASRWRYEPDGLSTLWEESASEDPDRGEWLDGLHENLVAKKPTH
jgi:hypothetical protein